MRFYLRRQLRDSSEHGTWLNEKGEGKAFKLQHGKPVRLHPGDIIGFGAECGEGRTFKVKQMHVSQRGEGLLACNIDGSARRYKVAYRSQREGAPA